MNMYKYTHTHLHILLWPGKEGSAYHIDHWLQNLLHRLRLKHCTHLSDPEISIKAWRRSQRDHRWGLPCRLSSDNANTDWVHCPGSHCRVKWQTVLPALWSQRRRDVGCATATMATDANVVTMSPEVALLAEVLHFIAIYEFKLELQSGNDQIGFWPWPLTSDLYLLHGHHFCQW